MLFLFAAQNCSAECWDNKNGLRVSQTRVREGMDSSLVSSPWTLTRLKLRDWVLQQVLSFSWICVDLEVRGVKHKIRILVDTGAVNVIQKGLIPEEFTHPIVVPSS